MNDCGWCVFCIETHPDYSVVDWIPSCYGDCQTLSHSDPYTITSTFLITREIHGVTVTFI